MLRKFKSFPDNCYYICGVVTLKQYRRDLTQHENKLYALYFGCEVWDQVKQWEPLSKHQSDFFASCLQQWNLLYRDVLMASFRKFSGDLQQCLILKTTWFVVMISDDYSMPSK